uniref:ORF2 n=1 Tax=Spiraea yellow leafspot virus TaxID=157271 RepID=A0A8E7IJN0_9VIRU|nr:ORF2 [Spiraea yellow leafspot virus]
MSSWELAAEEQAYNEAVAATSSLSNNQRGEGFIRPHEYTGGQLSVNLAKQNNTLIYLCVGLLKKQEQLETRLQKIEAKITGLDTTVKGKAAVALPESIVNDLSKEFEKLSTGARKKGPVAGRKDNFLVWKDPRDAAVKKPDGAPATSRDGADK